MGFLINKVDFIGIELQVWMLLVPLVVIAGAVLGRYLARGMG
ncbi:MAG TPA: hypothetical protein VFB45_24015 [Pseudolabrys sp.]|nr:hypothetical protein [Pseudolabrys sp.]